MFLNNVEAFYFVLYEYKVSGGVWNKDSKFLFYGGKTETCCINNNYYNYYLLIAKLFLNLNLAYFYVIIINGV